MNRLIHITIRMLLLAVVALTSSNAWADEELELSGTVYAHELPNNAKIKMTPNHGLVLVVDEDKIIDYIKGEGPLDVVMYKDLAISWVQCWAMYFYGTGNGGQNLNICNTTNRSALYATRSYIRLEDLNINLYNASGDKSALRAETDANAELEVSINNCTVNCTYTDGDAMILLNENEDALSADCRISNSTINMSDAIPSRTCFIKQYPGSSNLWFGANDPSEIYLNNVSGRVHKIESVFTQNKSDHHGLVRITGTGDLRVDQISGSRVEIDNEKLYVGRHTENADWNGSTTSSGSVWGSDLGGSVESCIYFNTHLKIDVKGSYTFYGPITGYKNGTKGYANVSTDQYFTNLDPYFELSPHYSILPADTLIHLEKSNLFRFAALNLSNPKCEWYINRMTAGEFIRANGTPSLPDRAPVGYELYSGYSIYGDCTYTWLVDGQPVEGVSTSTYVLRPEDADKNVMLKMSSNRIIGDLYSNKCYVYKYDQTNVPNTPNVVVAKSGNSGIKCLVTNARQTQEYFVSYVKDSPDRLTENDWSNAVSPDANGTFEITDYCNPNHVNYVYTRIKADDTHYAGTVVKFGMAYFGAPTETVMNDFKMTVTPVNCTIDDDNNGSYDVPLGGVLKVTVSPVPANAVDAADFQGAKFSLIDLKSLSTSDCGRFFTDEACTQIARGDINFKEVYLKCNKPGNSMWISANCSNPSKTHSIGLNIKDAEGNIYPDNIVSDESLGVVIERPSTSGWSRDVGFTVYPNNANIDGLSIEWGTAAEGIVRPSLQVLGDDRVVRLSDPGETLSLGTWYAYFMHNGERITYFNTSASMKVTVIPMQPRDVFFSLSDVTIDPGDSFDLSDFITVNPLDAEYELSYSIEGSNGITVDAAGVVTVDDNENMFGETAVVTITATGSENTATTTVTVKVSGEKYGVKVKDVQVNSNNKDDILGDGKVAYDPATNTLTLMGVDESYEGTVFINSIDANDLTIKVIGENNITVPNNGDMAIAGNNITITGSGTLNLTGYCGIMTNRGVVEINGAAKVNIEGAEYGSWSTPVYQSGVGLVSTGSLVLNDMAELDINASKYPVWFESLTMGDGFVIVSPEDGSFETVDAGSGFMVGTIVDNEYNIAANQTVVIKNVEALRGDADLSGDVDVADITHVNNYILLRRDYVNSFLNADIDASSQLDIVDVTGIANISLSAEASSAPVMSSRIAPRNKADYSLFEDYLSANDMALKAGEHKSLLIELNSSIDYTAFQMDITLPEGVKIAKAQLGDRVGRSHVLAMRDNGAFTRLMSYSSKNSSIEAGQGTILMLDLVAEDSFFNEGEIWFDNIRFVPTDGEKVFLPAFNVMLGTTTGIDKVDVNPSGVSVSNGVLTINGANGGVATITSMNGVTRTVTLDSGVNQVELDHGVYIVTVNGQSVKVRL